MRSSPRLRMLATGFRALLRAAAIAGGIVTVGVPGVSFFAGYGPPLFPPIGLLVGVIGVMVYVFVFQSAPSSASVNLPPAARVHLRQDVGQRTRSNRVIVCLLIAFVLLACAYFTAFSLWTAKPPAPREGPAVQVGFHLAEWSLRPKARAWVIENPNQCLPDVMLAFGGFSDAGVTRIWEPWSIHAAGVMLIGLFSATFLVWALLVAHLTRRLQSIRRGSDIGNLWNLLSLGG